MTKHHYLFRALKLHPTTILFYTLAAQHELNQGSPSAARNILQRGIRLNPENVEIWDAYVKMELGWVEMLRRRWERLGIAIAVDTTASTTPVAHASNDGPNEVDGPTSDLMGDAETLEISGNQSQIARRRILQGAIVKEVIEDAMKGKLNS